MEDELPEDLAAIWRSELAAIAADREVWENWTALMGLWLDLAAKSLPPPADERAPGGADAVQPAGPEAADAAPGPGPVAVGRLEQRIAELEQRLAAYERRDRGT